MLRAIEERLKRLAAEENNDFHDQIRRRVGKRATQLLEQRLRNLIHLMPKLLTQSLVHCNRKEIPSSLKREIGFLLAYLYQPHDFLPEDNQRLFGYLDDAYCVAIVYDKILRHLRKSGVPLSANDEQFAAQFTLMKRGVKAVIPQEARKISEMLAGISKSDNELFYTAFS